VLFVLRRYDGVNERSIINRYWLSTIFVLENSCSHESPLYFFMFERVQTNTLEPNIKNNVGWNSLLMFPLNLPMCNRSLFVWLWWRYTVIEKYRNNKPTIGTIEPIHWLHHLKVKFIGNRVTSKVVKN
jgi:hypothetical protein